MSEQIVVSQLLIKQDVKTEDVVGSLPTLDKFGVSTKIPPNKNMAVILTILVPRIIKENIPIWLPVKKVVELQLPNIHAQTTNVLKIHKENSILFLLVT